MIWFPVVMLLVTGLLLHWTPIWSRRDILFAVTVRPDFRGTREARGIVLRYRAAVWGATLVGALMLTAWGQARSIVMAPALQMVATMAAWAWAHRATMPYRTAAPTTVSASLDLREPRPPMQWPALLGPFLILGGAAAALYWNWDSIPERFPAHWGLDGSPDRWVTRSFRNVNLPLLMGGIVVAIMTAMMFLVRDFTPRSAGQAEEVERQSRLRNGTVKLLLFSNYFMAVLFSYFALRPILETSERLNPAVFLPILTCGVAVLIIGVVRLAGVASSAPTSLQTVMGDRTDDARWKWGQFYVNRNDPALMVEKRFGVGYTLNFGHWQAWALLALILFAPMLIAWLV